MARALGLDLDDRNLYHKAETVHALLGSLLEAASFGPAQVPNTAFDAAASLAEVLKTGEDIIRRQRIMATTEDWNKDPTIGVRTEEGALWREAVRRHIRDKQPTNAKILRELEELLDIDRHILDQKFNRVQGTRAGFIESYLNHSYRIQAFLEKYG